MAESLERELLWTGVLPSRTGDAAEGKRSSVLEDMQQRCVEEDIRRTDSEIVCLTFPGNGSLTTSRKRSHADCTRRNISNIILS